MYSDKYISIRETKGSNELIIEIPGSLKGKQVRITIEEAGMTREEMIKRMDMVVNDPLFQDDVEEIMADFEHVDRESL